MADSTGGFGGPDGGDVRLAVRRVQRLLERRAV